MKSWLEKFEEASEENRILSEQEGLALEVAEALWEAMERSGMTKAEFAKKMGKSKAYVTRLLQGNYNLTLGTLAEVACFLGRRVEVSLVQGKTKSQKVARINSGQGRKEKIKKAN